MQQILWQWKIVNNLDFNVHCWKNENKILISLCTGGKMRTKSSQRQKYLRNSNGSPGAILTEVLRKKYGKYFWKMENFKISVSIQWWGGVPVTLIIRCSYINNQFHFHPSVKCTQCSSFSISDMSLDFRLQFFSPSDLLRAIGDNSSTTVIWLKGQCHEKICSAEALGRWFRF